MKKIIILLFVISGLLLAITSNNDKNTIIMYSSLEQFRNDKLQEDLGKEFKDKNVRVMYIPTAKAAAKILLEGDKTDADIFVGLETSYAEKIQGNLAEVGHFSRMPYLDEFSRENTNPKYVIWERQAGSFVINTKMLEKLNLPIPTSYEDLLNPLYKGLIAMPDPKSSGTGFFFYKNRVNTLGDKGAIDYFNKLSSNVKQFTKSGSGPIKLLNQEEVAIGLALTFQGVNEINNNRDYTLIYPEEGSPYSLTAAGMIKGRENNKDVLEVFDYMIHEFFTYDKENFSTEQVFEGQVNRVKNYPKNINYADMTGIESITEKERLLDLWKH